MKIELLLKPRPDTPADSEEHLEWMDTLAQIHVWWKKHGWDPVPLDALPALGAWVKSREGIPLAAAWLYQDNSSPVCVLEWIVSNPDTPALANAKGIKFLIAFLTEEARELGYRYVMSSTKVPGLISLLQRSDFKVTDTGLTHLILNLKS